MDVPQPPADQPSAQPPAQAPAQTIDITAEVCPMTFVRTKLKLERMRSGEILRVRLRGDEPLRNVPRAARDEGHAILAIEGDDDAHIVTIQRA
jgi:TusA-related sulfurtransferase